jgi:hypothetical protein
MLYVCLVLSAILLVFANRAAFHPDRPLRGFFVAGFVVSAGPLGLTLVCPPVWLLFLLLTITLLFWNAYSKKPGVFLTLSFLVTLLAFAYPVYSAVEETRLFARLREKYPSESLEGRLPVVPSSLRPGKLSEQTRESLNRVEGAVVSHLGNTREWALRDLHDAQVNLFISSPGFGVMRMPPRPSESRVSLGLREEKPVPQPTYYVASPPSLGKPVTPGWVEKAPFAQLHESGVLDFSYPEGFGLFVDRSRIAGFRPHQFSAVPGPEERWEVRRLDLISLLLHDAPVAYVSEDLPRMDALRAAPTRPLDSFEAAALEDLRKGEDLLVSGPEGEMRMLGAVRATEQCLKCHGAERGDLLGAFSYLLRRGESPTP